jgi:hypothetical protein
MIKRLVHRSASPPVAIRLFWSRYDYSMRFLRVPAAFCIVLIVAFASASQSPALDEAQVLRIAADFAQTQNWDVTRPGNHARFIDKTREWQVFIQTKQNGGPMIVYVRDDTKKVRFTRGE